jgi:hypothetical protein
MISSRPVTKLWASLYWKRCSASKLLSEKGSRQVTGRVAGRDAHDLEPPSDRALAYT